jgi:hypothetical protein
VDIPNANRSKTAIHECFLAHVQCRKESGLAPLDSKAAKAHKNQLNSLFQKIGSGETLNAIYGNAGKFAEEYSHAVANDQVNLHVAASFTAHLTCVHNALNDLAAYMRNHEKLTQDDVKAIKPSIIRLHSALDEDKKWRGIVPFLNLSLQTVRNISDQIKIVQALKYQSYLLPKLEVIEQMLTPPRLGKTTKRAKPDPLEQASETQKYLEKQLAETVTQHKTELARKQADHTRATELLRDDIETEKKRRETAEAELVKLRNDHSNALIKLKRAHKTDLEHQKETHKHDLKKTLNVSEGQINNEWALKLKNEVVRVKGVQDTMGKEHEESQKALVAKRNELFARSTQNYMGIRSIETRQKDGTLTLLTQEHEIPSQHDCIVGLKRLWDSHGPKIGRLKPHELQNDHDLALEFEVNVILPARVFMMSLAILDAPRELLETGWSLSALDLVRCGLMPYHGGTELSILSVSVCSICELLQQATEVLANRRPAPVFGYAAPQTNNNASGLGEFEPAPNNAAPLMASFGSSMSSQASAVFDQSFASSMASNGTMATDVQSGQQSFTPQSSLSTGDTLGQSFQYTAPPSASFGPPSNAPAGPSQPSSPFAPATPSTKNEACPKMVSGFCGKGFGCSYSHDRHIVSAAKAAAQAAAGSSGDVNMDDMPEQVSWEANILCRNVQRWGWYSTQDCKFKHGPGEHASTGRLQTSAPQENFGNGHTHPKSPSAIPCRYEAKNGTCSWKQCKFMHRVPSAAPTVKSFTHPNSPLFGRLRASNDTFAAPVPDLFVAPSRSSRGSFSTAYPYELFGSPSNRYNQVHPPPRQPPPASAVPLKSCLKKTTEEPTSDGNKGSLASRMTRENSGSNDQGPGFAFLNQARNAPLPSYTCHECNQPGHFIIDCPQKGTGFGRAAANINTQQRSGRRSSQDPIESQLNSILGSANRRNNTQQGSGPPGRGGNGFAGHFGSSGEL